MLVRQYIPLGDGPQVRAVVALAVAVRALEDALARDPSVLVGDLLGHRDRQVLGALDGAHELGRLEEALHSARVEPGEAAAQRHHVEQAVLEVHAVEVGDLVLAARRGHDSGRALGDARRVEVEPGHGVVALGVRRLLLDGDGVVVGVELDDPEALGVVHAVAEDRGAPLGGTRHRPLQALGEPVAVEDVVAQDQCAGVAADPVRADGEGLCQTVGARLLGVGELDAEVAPVAQQALEVREVRGRRDQEDLADARQHQRGERVVDHRLVVDREQLLAGNGGQRIQTCAAAAGEDNALQFSSLLLLHLPSILPFENSDKCKQPNKWNGRYC